MHINNPTDDPTDQIIIIDKNTKEVEDTKEETRTVLGHTFSISDTDNSSWKSLSWSKKLAFSFKKTFSKKSFDFKSTDTKTSLRAQAEKALDTAIGKTPGQSFEKLQSFIKSLSPVSTEIKKEVCKKIADAVCKTMFFDSKANKKIRKQQYKDVSLFLDGKISKKRFIELKKDEIQVNLLLTEEQNFFNDLFESLDKDFGLDDTLSNVELTCEIKKVATERCVDQMRVKYLNKKLSKQIETFMKKEGFSEHISIYSKGIANSSTTQILQDQATCTKELEESSLFSKDLEIGSQDFQKAAGEACEILEKYDSIEPHEDFLNKYVNEFYTSGISSLEKLFTGKSKILAKSQARISEKFASLSASITSMKKIDDLFQGKGKSNTEIIQESLDSLRNSKASIHGYKYLKAWCMNPPDGMILKSSDFTSIRDQIQIDNRDHSRELSNDLHTLGNSFHHEAKAMKKAEHKSRKDPQLG